MSHTIQGVWDDPQLLIPAILIVNYVAGGEAITAAEVNAPSVDAVFFAIVAAGSNSLGVPLIPAIVGNKIMLFRVTGGVLSEIPTTTALNASVRAIVLSQSLADRVQ